MKVSPSRSQQMAEFVERRKYLLLAALTAIFAVGAAARAAARPFWYDEIITLVSARQPDLATAWKAALVTDANPPLPHIATHLAVRWLGVTEVTARLPAMLGFWVFCLCLFVFVARRKGVLIGLSALLLPIVTDALTYAADARAYGLELGFCGMVLVAWQSAAEGRRRVAALVVLALSIGAMLMCHYYAILVYFPLAVAELVRARSRRALDWGVAAAMAAGIAPLVWRLQQVMGTVQAFSHGWSSAYLRQGIEFWETALNSGAAWLAMLLVLVAFARRGKIADPGGEVPAHEWTAAALFLVVPLAAVLAAITVTHAFTPRYAIIGIAGFCLLVPLLAAEYAGARSTLAALLAAVLVWATVIRMADRPAPRNPFADEQALAQALEKEPVVVADGQLFLQMWHYAPDRLKPRLIFLSDPDAALRYMGFDTIDYGVRPMRSWTKLNVINYSDFAKETSDFLVYRDLLRPEWVTPRVLADGASVELLNAPLHHELVRVRLHPRP